MINFIVFFFFSSFLIKEIRARGAEHVGGFIWSFTPYAGHIKMGLGVHYFDR